MKTKQGLERTEKEDSETSKNKCAKYSSKESVKDPNAFLVFPRTSLIPSPVISVLFFIGSNSNLKFYHDF